MAVVVYVPVESTQNGFYVIPGYTKYGASEDGKIINISTGHMKKYYNVRGYAATTVMSDIAGVMKWMFVHRLVALAFHGPISNDKPIVNHRDNDKTNNRPDNLEWTDYSGNIHHAYRTGQRSDNRPVLAKDLRDGSILKFHSANECARHFATTGERIWRNIRDNTGNIYFDYFVFRYVNDKRPWPNLTKNDVGKINNGDPLPVQGKHIESGKVFIADSVAQLSAGIGIKVSTITYAMRTGRQYPCKGYLFKRLSDKTPWIH